MQPSAITILVVEDEMLIRMDAVDQLEALGFRVLEAGTAQQALDTIAREHRVDVVFTDVDMPGRLNGVALACKVDAKWPEIGLIVTSGQAIVHASDLPAGTRFFAKPYSVSTIGAVVNDLVA